MSKPNVLIIMSDQHRYDCMGAYGNKDIQTPYLDRLANDGVVYTDCFCPAPLCTPSRYSFLTGLYPHQHLGWTNRSTIPPQLPTFARLMKEEGYRTHAIGKMHMTPTYLDVGFERMELSEQNGSGRYEDDYHEFLRSQGRLDIVDLIDQDHVYRKQAPDPYWSNLGALESDLPQYLHSTTWIGDRAISALDDWTSEGNLLMVSFVKPHHPFDPPAPWSGMYNPAELTLLPGWTPSFSPLDAGYNNGFFSHGDLNEHALRQVMAMYYASISQIDAQVGRMLSKLKENCLYNNTLIVYTSDHGEYMGYHHMLLKQNYMYEPLVRIPLIIKYPGENRSIQKKEGRLCNLLDVTATVLSKADIPLPRFMDGSDLEKGQERAFVFTEEFWGRQYMIRTKTRKLLWCKEAKSQLFDLELDPWELQNVIDDPLYSVELQQLKDELSAFLLFGTPTPVYLDEKAPSLHGEEAIQRGSETREWVSKHFTMQMKAYFQKYNQE